MMGSSVWIVLFLLYEYISNRVDIYKKNYEINTAKEYNFVVNILKIFTIILVKLYIYINI